MTGRTLEQARAAKAHAVELFQPMAAVVGVGITKVGNGYGLKVNLRRAPAKKAALPSLVDGVPVVVDVVGAVHKR